MRRGLALVLTVGILTLLALSATLLAGLAAQLRLRGTAVIDDRQARLLSRSGVEYASARLFEESSPRTPPTAGNQADDWMFRDGAGAPLQTALNPSYAQTELYADLNGNGRYDPKEDGLAPGGDWNRNGRFDAWSGRLRSRYGLAGGAFALKVTSEGAKLDINAGLLSRTDWNANGVPDYRDPSWDGPQPLSKPPATHGYTYQYETRKNRQLAHAINLLGQTLGASLQVGDALIQGRPMGGYRSLEEARRILSPGDFARIGPYLGLASERKATRHKRLYHDGKYGGVGSPKTDPGCFYESVDRVPVINLGAADPPLLQALFTGLMGLEGQTYPSALHMQDSFGLGVADARRVADFLAANRPFASRYELFRKLDAAKEPLFPVDHPLIRILKGDLAFANADPDNNFYANVTPDDSSVISPFNWPQEGGESFPLMSWRTYDLPRYTWGNGEARVLRVPAALSWGKVLPVPEAIPAQPYGYNNYYLSFVLSSVRPLVVTAGLNSVPVDFGTLPLSLASSGSIFRVECAGRVASSSGTVLARDADSTVVSVGGSLAINSQAGFENLKGIGRPLKVQTQTYPRYPLDSCTDLASDSRYAFPDDYGAIALMRYAGWVDGKELLYQPCWETKQPLRKSASTLLLDNFRDEAGSRPPDEGLARDRILQGYHVSTVHNEWYGYLTAILPGGSGTLGFSWATGAVPPWFDGNGVFREVSIDCWSFGDGGWACRNHDSNKAHYRDFGVVASSMEYAGPIRESVAGFKPGTQEAGGGPEGYAYANATSATPGTPRTAFFFYCDEERYVGNPYFLNPVYHQSGVSLGFYAAQTNHRVTLVIGSDDRGDGVATCYIDGIADPGMVTPMPDFSWNPADSASIVLNDELYGFQCRMSGHRLSAGQLNGSEVLARAVSQPAYWNGEIDPAAPEVPHYRSPLHEFTEPVNLKQVGWEGFVPELIRSGTVSSGSGRIPLQVDLLAYTGPGGTGEVVLPFPTEFWLMGGGRIDFKELWKRRFGPVPVPKIVGIRYRVWMDASQVNGFNNESPVFRSLGAGYRDRRRILFQE